MNTTKVLFGSFKPPRSCAKLDYISETMPNQLIARTVRLTPKQDRQLQRLSEKLGLDNTNVLRLALTRLAEAESVK